MRWSAPDFSRHDDQAQAYLLDFAGANHASRSVQWESSIPRMSSYKKNSSARSSSIAQTDFKSTHF